MGARGGMGGGMLRTCRIGAAQSCSTGLRCLATKGSLAGRGNASGVKDAGGAGAGSAGAGAGNSIGGSSSSSPGRGRGRGRSEDPKVTFEPPRTPTAHISQGLKLWALGLSSVAFVLGAYVSSRFVKDERRNGAAASMGSSSSTNTTNNAATLEQSSSNLNSASSAASSDIATVYDDPGFAATFDSETALHERLWGILSMRQRLVERASGRVIEVGAGTGRNTGFYRLAQCESVTLLDRSKAMLDVARKKWESVRDEKIRDAEGCESGEERRRRLLLAEVESGKVRFLHRSIFDLARTAAGHHSSSSSSSSAGDGLEEYDGEGKYDTVVQTMSLCSTDEPEALLGRLGRLVKAESGRILLLEHGRSKYGILNGWLDGSAEKHAEKFGCWWNRDVGGLVERSGLEVVEMRRHHLGTTWWVVLKRPEGWKARA